MSKAVKALQTQQASNDLLHRALRALYPMSARPFSGDPTNRALAIMGIVYVAAVCGIVAYAIAGSQCVTQLQTQRVNPRTGCASRVLTAEEQASANVTKPVYGRTGPLLLTFTVPAEAVTAEEACQPSYGIVDNTTVADVVYDNDTDVYTIVHSDFPDESVRFWNPIPRSSFAPEMRIVCAGRGWAMFNHSAFNTRLCNEQLPLLPMFSLFVTDTWTIADVVPSSMTSLWFANALTEPETTLRFSLDQVETNYFRSIYYKRGRLSFDATRSRELDIVSPMRLTCATCASSGAVEIANVVNVVLLYNRSIADNIALAETCIHTSERVLFDRFLTFSAPIDNGRPYVEAQLQQGDVPLACQTRVCDGLLGRTARALSLALGVVGVVGCVVRVTPSCHVRNKAGGADTDDKPSPWYENVLPLEAVSIGRTPKPLATWIFISLQVVVVALTVWYATTKSACTFEVTNEPYNPRFDCSERELTTTELQSVVGKQASGSVLVLDSGWTRDCPSGTTGSDRQRLMVAALFRRPALPENEQHVLSYELCRLVDNGAVTSVSVANVATGDDPSHGLRVAWTRAGVSHVFESTSVPHLDAGTVIYRACGSEQIGMFEFFDPSEGGKVTVLLVDVSGTAVSRSTVEIPLADVVDLWRTLLETKAKVREFTVSLNSVYGSPRVLDAFAHVDGLSDHNTGFDVRIELRSAADQYALAHMVEETTNTTMRVATFTMAMNYDVAPSTVTSVIADGGTIRIGDEIRSLSTVSLHGNDLCLRASFDLYEGDMRLWCLRKSCTHLTRRLLDLSALGFAALAAAIFVIRLVPPLHTWADSLVSWRRSVLLIVYPSAASPRGFVPKRAAIVAVLVSQVLLTIALVLWAVQRDVCRQSFDLNADVETRKGCLLSNTRAFSVPEMRSILGEESIRDNGDFVLEPTDAKARETMHIGGKSPTGLLIQGFLLGRLDSSSVTGLNMSESISSMCAKGGGVAPSYVLNVTGGHIVLLNAQDLSPRRVEVNYVETFMLSS